MKRENMRKTTIRIRKGVEGNWNKRKIGEEEKEWKRKTIK